MSSLTVCCMFCIRFLSPGIHSSICQFAPGKKSLTTVSHFILPNLFATATVLKKSQGVVQIKVHMKRRPDLYISCTNIHIGRDFIFKIANSVSAE